MFPAGQGERFVILGGTQEAPLRMHLSKEAKQLFRAIFKANPYPSTATHRELAAHFGLTPKNVQLWFQNQRQRDKSAKLRGSARQPSSLQGNQASAVPVEVSTASVQGDPALLASGGWRGSHVTGASNVALGMASEAVGNSLPSGATCQCWPNAPQLHCRQGITSPLQMPPYSIPMVSRPPTGWHEGATFGMYAQPSQHEGQRPIQAMHPLPQYNRPGWYLPGHHVEVMPSPMAWACQQHPEQQRLLQSSAEGDFHSRYEQAGWTYVPVGPPGQPLAAMQRIHPAGGSSFQDSLPPLPPGLHHVPNMPNFSLSSNCCPQRLIGRQGSAFQPMPAGDAKDSMHTKARQQHR